MKILYVLRSIQHPSIMRGALRHYHFLRELAGRHSITLVALAEGEVPAEAAAELESLTRHLVVVPVEAPPGAGGRTIAERVRRKARLRRAVRHMRGVVDDHLRRDPPDVLLFHGKRVYGAIAGVARVPTVIDFCDATSLRQLERLRHTSPWALPGRLAGYVGSRHKERRLLDHGARLAFISPRDRDAVVDRRARARVVPNGIDLAYWSRGEGEWVPRPDRIVFTGVMDYAPNADAAHQLLTRVLPLLRRHRPELELVIAGRDPTPEIVRLAAADRGVTVTGFVDDLRPWLEGAAVYAAPIRYASGLQNKILEALAMEIPVVTTPAVAGGLRVEGATDPPVRIAEAGEAFARETLALLADEPARRRLARDGRSFVVRHFSWQRGAELLEEMCIEALRDAGTDAGHVRAAVGARGRP